MPWFRTAMTSKEARNTARVRVVPGLRPATVFSAQRRILATKCKARIASQRRADWRAEVPPMSPFWKCRALDRWRQTRFGQRRDAPTLMQRHYPFVA